VVVLFKVQAGQGARFDFFFPLKLTKRHALRIENQKVIYNLPSLTEVIRLTWKESQSFEKNEARVVVVCDTRVTR